LETHQKICKGSYC